MIISDRGLQIVARFWEQLHASLRTHLIHSSAYHPQTDSLCFGTSRKLESKFALGQILLQQQLSRESKDATVRSVIRTLMPHPTQLD
jgi:hypothetical protein